jgi:hypothetical protein
MQFHLCWSYITAQFAGMVRFGYVPNNWCGTSCDVVLDLKWVGASCIDHFDTKGQRMREITLCVQKKKKIRGGTWELCIVLIIFTQGTKDERDHIVCRRKQNQMRDLRRGEEEKKMKKKGQRMRSHCVYKKKTKSEEGLERRRSRRRRRDKGWDHIVCIEKNKIRGGTWEEEKNKKKKRRSRIQITHNSLMQNLMLTCFPVNNVQMLGTQSLLEWRLKFVEQLTLQSFHNCLFCLIYYYCRWCSCVSGSPSRLPLNHSFPARLALSTYTYSHSTYTTPRLCTSSIHSPMWVGSISCCLLSVQALASFNSNVLELLS